MHTGPMPISEFVRIVQDNQNQHWGGVRVYSTRWGPRQGAPAGTCTMTFGDWEEGWWYNVPIPNVPEKGQSVKPHGKGKKLYEGWRTLLKDMVRSRLVRPTKELENVLGQNDLYKASQGVWL